MEQKKKTLENIRKNQSELKNVLCLVVSDSFLPHGLQLAKLLCPWGFSRQEYWNELPYPPPGDLPNPGIKPRSPALQADSLPSESPGKPRNTPERIDSRYDDTEKWVRNLEDRRVKITQWEQQKQREFMRRVQRISGTSSSILACTLQGSQRRRKGEKTYLKK